MNRLDPRIKAARAAVRVYVRSKRISLMQSEEETLADLLTDLRHYCQEHEVSFQTACERSAVHFEAECWEAAYYDERDGRVPDS